jgi:hypothetical protein
MSEILHLLIKGLLISGLLGFVNLLWTVNTFLRFELKKRIEHERRKNDNAKQKNKNF